MQQFTHFSTIAMLVGGLGDHVDCGTLPMCLNHPLNMETSLSTMKPQCETEWQAIQLNLI